MQHSLTNQYPREVAFGLGHIGAVRATRPLLETDGPNRLTSFSVRLAGSLGVVLFAALLSFACSSESDRSPGSRGEVNDDPVDIDFASRCTSERTLPRTRITSAAESTTVEGAARGVLGAIGAAARDSVLVARAPERCSVLMEVDSLGVVEVHVARDPSGDWLASGLSPAGLSDAPLSLSWSSADVFVASGFTCPDCVRAELSLEAGGETWQARATLPIDQTISAGGVDSDRTVLVEFFDEFDDRRAVILLVIERGPFAAG